MLKLRNRKLPSESPARSGMRQRKPPGPAACLHVLPIQSGSHRNLWGCIAGLVAVIAPSGVTTGRRLPRLGCCGLRFGQRMLRGSRGIMRLLVA